LSRIREPLLVHIDRHGCQRHPTVHTSGSGSAEFAGENGYELVTATNGHDGLRLFMSRPVDTIVLEYPLGLLDGSVIAAEIKQVRPKLPIIMLAGHAELPEGALKSVDMLVSKSDPPHFLWAAVHFVLNVKLDHGREEKPRSQTPPRLRRSG
jgi:DNA-binding response OmpR family regulator